MADDTHKSWGSLQERWEFAKTPEQVGQTRITGRRRLFQGVIGYPINFFANHLLVPDRTNVKGFFDASAALLFANNAIISPDAGQVIRSMTSGYEKHENYMRAKETATHLAGMAMSAETADSSPPLSREIRAGRQSLFQHLFTTSFEAGQLLDRFITGTLPITPTHLENLNLVLTELAELSSQRAELMEGYASLAVEPAPSGIHKPGDYIREVVRKDKITSLRDAQIFMGFVSALLIDSAVPFSSEIYIPQEKIFISMAQNKMLAKTIQERLHHAGYALNIPATANSPLIAADVAEGVMVKRDETGYRIVPPEEIIAFADEMRSELGKLKGFNMERMLDFADAHFLDIEDTLAHDKNVKPDIEKLRPELDMQAQAQITLSPGANDSIPVRYGNTAVRDAGHLFTAVSDFVRRPHMKTELSKLTGRTLSNHIIALPMNIFNEMIRNFFHSSVPGKPQSGFDMIFRGSHNASQGVPPLFAQGQLEKILKSSLVRSGLLALTLPAGTVYLQEGSRVGAALAVDAAKQSDPLITAALCSGQRYIPEFAHRIAAMHAPHPAVASLMDTPEYKNRISALLNADTNSMTADDFRLLSQFFHDMSRISVSMAEEVLSPFQKSEGRQRLQSMDEVAERLFAKPIATVPDAMMALAFAQAFMRLSTENLEMIEYVDPKHVVIKQGDLKQLSYFIEDLAKSQKLVVRNDNGIPALFQMTLSGLVPASPQSIIMLGRKVAQKLGETVSLPGLIAYAKGEFHEEIVRHMEESLFKDVYFPTASIAQETPPAAGKDVTLLSRPSLTQAWVEKTKRPKPGIFTNILNRWKNPEIVHEGQKLYDRLAGERIPSVLCYIIQNALLHQNSIYDRGNIVATVWKYLVDPIVYGKGLVDFREVYDEIFTHKHSMVHDAGHASQTAIAAVRAASVIQPELAERISRFTASNLQLEALQSNKDGSAIARITVKPRMERTAEDNAVMADFYRQAGDKLLQVSGGMLASLHQNPAPESFQQALLRVTSSPVDNLADAVIGLSFLAGIIRQNAIYLEKQTYVDPRNIMMDKKALHELSAYMADQAYAAGFAVQKKSTPQEAGMEEMLVKTTIKGKTTPSEEDIIRFANVSLEKFRMMRERMPKLARSFSYMTQNESKHYAVSQAKQLLGLNTLR